MTDEELDKRLDSFRADIWGKRSLGFYLHILFMIGALASVISASAWKVLLVVFLHVPVIFFFMLRPLSWNWTERRLHEDVIAGRTNRAVCWDYLAALIDWALSFCVFSLFAVCTFALADGYAMSSTLVWLCVAGFRTFPTTYCLRDPPYSWGNVAFWLQWGVVVLLLASMLLPIGPGAGIAIMASTAVVAVPLACIWKKDSIKTKVANYRAEVLAAQGRRREPPPPLEMNPFAILVQAVKEHVHISKLPFFAVVATFLTGFVWAVWLGRLLAIPFAALAVMGGFIVQILLANPLAVPREELVKRNIDVDITLKCSFYRFICVVLPLLLSAIVILWLGGRDVALLAALSILAFGALHITAAIEVDRVCGKADWIFAAMYLPYFAAVCALRFTDIPGPWCCLIPLPLFASLPIVIRWYFPRSGLRGAERRAASADTPRRLVADIRSDAEKARDEAAEKRRRRNERRLANFRRSRGAGHS